MSIMLVIYGASGDLTSRKLIPSLYQLHRKGRLPKGTCIVGFSRTPFSDEQWRDTLAKSTAKTVKDRFDDESWNSFAQLIHYHQGDIGQDDSFRSLSRRLQELEQGQETTRVYYLATAPRFYEPVVAAMGRCQLADQSCVTQRLVVEKPFGIDLPSAQSLNASIHHVFPEECVYRIDHYLGKETVQNILVLRFANTIFEPLWNRTYIDHVQITVAEEVTVGQRGGYYDTAGVLRDMFQNHLLQLMMIVAMEAPVRFEADLVRNEKVKVLQSMRPFTPTAVMQNTLRAQYRGYHDEPGVSEESQTATFAALKLYVDNWRWHGVPFYLRSGKGMSCRSSQIVVKFRNPPHMMFGPTGASHESNQLVIQVQPAEGIQIHFQTKVPDAGMKLRLTDLEFRFADEFAAAMPDAYERLLLDVFLGDASLFARADEVELAWGIIDPIHATWAETGQPELLTYDQGLWGPTASTRWMHQQHREWFDLCPVLLGQKH